MVFLLLQDYSRDFLKLEARFSTEAACEEHLFRLSWLEGFSPDRCEGRRCSAPAWTGENARPVMARSRLR